MSEQYGKSDPLAHGLPSLDEQRVQNELLRTELDAAYRGTPWIERARERWLPSPPPARQRPRLRSEPS